MGTAEFMGTRARAHEHAHNLTLDLNRPIPPTLTFAVDLLSRAARRAARPVLNDDARPGDRSGKAGHHGLLSRAKPSAVATQPLGESTSASTLLNSSDRLVFSDFLGTLARPPQLRPLPVGAIRR